MVLTSYPSLKSFTPAHLMMAAYYLLLQDRVEDAQRLFSRIPAPSEGKGSFVVNLLLIS